MSNLSSYVKWLDQKVNPDVVLLDIDKFPSKWVVWICILASNLGENVFPPSLANMSSYFWIFVNLIDEK